MKARALTLSDVYVLVVHRGISAPDAITAYYAAREDNDLAAALKECTRALANAEEGRNACLITNSRLRLSIITAETERRELAASRVAPA
jgi:hypothetical protein